ncbi:hypothetical protein GCM10027022_11040 [Alpinimonas psychrophila]|uniref:Uncharacterized protein n=1 Tax=Alpinimonas psychrophila TaxID=748908 RepID=A0A7W3JTF6_9MICO|nr:hypothetical protein [Alpinimonas psychrophila]MBA8828929.1 hypothetical protein [Alpinimonas psychrophila]
MKLTRVRKAGEARSGTGVTVLCFDSSIVKLEFAADFVPIVDLVPIAIHGLGEFEQYLDLLPNEEME